MNCTTILFLLLVLYIVFINYISNTNNKEQFTDNKNCRKPTKDNPYMNYTLYTDDNKTACKNVDTEIKTEYMKHTIYDRKDIFGKNISSVHFYTMPSTGIINDQNKFAKSLYTIKNNCKMNNKDCYKW